MLSISAAAGNEYYLNLSRQDYYQNGVEPPGQWAGKGAAALGLSGVVEAEALRDLMEGYSPGGQPLVQNAGKGERKPAWDLCFSASKTVSTIWSQADAATRQAIEAAHAASVRAACDYLEADAGWTRRGRAGAQRERAGLVFALYEHGASRLGDPQLHTHALLCNVGVRAEGTTGSLESKPVFQHKMAAGALYRAELAARLQQMGFPIERSGAFFEIAGVPQKLCDAFSRRRAQIKEQIKQRGITTAAGAAAAALATRTAKKAVSREVLREQWQQIGQTFGFGETQVTRLLRSTQLHKKDTTPLFRAGVAELLQGESHFTERVLLRFAAEAAPGTALGAADLQDGMKRFLAHEPTLVAIGPGCYTTKDVLAVEQELLASAKRLHESGQHKLPPTMTKRAAQKAEKAASAAQQIPVKLSDEQRAALEYVTTQEGSLQLVSGMAGTGKTFFLSAAKSAWEEAGYQVIGASLSGKAARGLQDGAGITSATVTRLLMDLDYDWKHTLGHHLWQLGRAAQGKKTWGPPERMGLNRNTVLVIDEAAMLGSKMLNALLKAVEKAGAKLVLVGDAKQLQAIETGGAFLELQKRFGAAELSAIQRQREAWAREAVKDFAEGRTAKALEAYAARGLLTVTKTRHDAMEQLLTDWKKAGGIERPEDSLIFTGLRAERAVMNRWAQQERKNAGKLGVRYVTVDGEKLHTGDRVAFSKNSKRLGVENGTLGVIEDISLLGSRLRVRLDDKRCISFTLSEYRALELSYASTAHKGQGCTVENAFVLAGGPMQDRELSYVQMSRARGTTRLYWDNAEPGPLLEPLTRAMQTSRQKEMATVIQARQKAQAAKPTVPVAPTVAPVHAPPLLPPSPRLAFVSPPKTEPETPPIPVPQPAEPPGVVPEKPKRVYTLRPR